MLHGFSLMILWLTYTTLWMLLLSQYRIGSQWNFFFHINLFFFLIIYLFVLNTFDYEMIFHSQSLEIGYSFDPEKKKNKKWMTFKVLKLNLATKNHRSMGSLKQKAGLFTVTSDKCTDYKPQCHKCPCKSREQTALVNTPTYKRVLEYIFF